MFVLAICTNFIVISGVNVYHVWRHFCDLDGVVGKGAEFYMFEVVLWVEIVVGLIGLALCGYLLIFNIWLRMKGLTMYRYFLTKNSVISQINVIN